jgi:peptidoglycan/LPS O-acetylase OafA/YrhL
MDPEFKTNNFDLLRILAAAQVVLGHSLAHLGIARPGWWGLVEAFPGVPIFFAISGFLISASFERSADLGGYARNRALRIFPGLWCCVLVTVPVAAAFGFDLFHERALAWLLAQGAGLVYTPSFLRGFGFGSYNGSLWTIPIELQFYAVLPLLYRLTRRAAHRTRALGAITVVFMLAGVAFARITPPLLEDAGEPLAHKLLRYSFLPHVYLFLAGVMLQRWRVHRSPWIAGRGHWWLAAFLAFHFALPWGAASYVVGSLLTAVAVVSLAFTAPALSSRLLRGHDLSYGVYIYHGLVLNVLIELGLHGRWRHMGLVLVLTPVLAGLSWVLVERPFLRRKRNAMHPAIRAAA